MEVASICPPFASDVAMKDETGRFRTGVPTMFVCAPVRDANFQVVAALGLRIRPEREFTRILQLGRIGETGETYAFDKTGLMVSNSRFDEQLILLGLLPDQPHSHSILNLQIRDPGGDMTARISPERPAARAAADAHGGGRHRRQIGRERGRLPRLSRRARGRRLDVAARNTKSASSRRSTTPRRFAR